MSGRVRAVWDTVSSSPWRRAPLLLWRRPGVLAAVAGACAVMVAAVAAVPLFLSSAGTASVGLQVGERCPRDTGVTRVENASTEELRSPDPDPFRPLANLRPANRWAGLEQVPIAGADPTRTEETFVLTRDDATDHVEVLDGPADTGVWITDRAAEATGLQVGDVATVGATRTPVAAIYRDLAGYDVDQYWCSNAELVLIQSQGDDLVPPPPLVLADRNTFADIVGGLGYPGAQMVTEAGLDDDVTVAEARGLVHELACHGPEVDALAWCDRGQPAIVSRVGGVITEVEEAADDVDFVERYFSSSLPFVARRSEAIQTAVGSGIWPVSALASLAGAGLVAAAAALWFDRRRREVVLLSVRGVSPLGLGGKAVLELALPLLAGGVAGLALANRVVVWLGPSPVLEPAAIGRAARGAAAAVGVAACIVAAVVAARVPAGGPRHARRWSVGSLPWELVLVGATFVSYRRLGEWGVPVDNGAEVSRVDVLGLLFPVLFLLTVVAVISRLLSLALRPVRAVSRSWPAALYLAVRRVARARVAVLGLVAASAVAVGVLVYAASMDRSLQTSLDAKAMTFVGSDTAVMIDDDAVLPRALRGRATVVRVLDGSIGTGERESVRFIALDPGTFAEVAYWDDSFADASLGDITGRLSGPSEDTVPAVVVGGDLEGPTEAVMGVGLTEQFTVDPVAEVSAFPGMKRDEPTVYIDGAVLDGSLVSTYRTETWFRGDRSTTLELLREANLPFEEVRRADEVADESSFVTVSWTFGFMRSLALTAGLLALGGVAVYLDARRRERTLGHALLRRMGLTRGQHRAAVLVELVACVVVGCSVGVVAAVGGTWLAHGRVDPVPELRPAPLLRLSVGVIGAAVLAAIVVVVVASRIAQRRTDRDDPVEVLRAGA